MPARGQYGGASSGTGQHRPARAGRGAAALLAGIAGMAAGAGIASGHARAGMSAGVLTALAVLLAGVILLGWGGTTLVRLLPGWRRLLAVPAALAIVIFLLYPLTVAVNATNRAADGREPVTPASRGLAYRDVTLRTSDGVRLAAWYLPSRNGAAVVALPGAGSTRSTLVKPGGQPALAGRPSWRAMIIRCTSEVPSPISRIFASR